MGKKQLGLAGDRTDFYAKLRLGRRKALAEISNQVYEIFNA